MESRLMIAWDSREEEEWEVIANGFVVYSWADESILGLDSSGDYTTLWISYNPLNFML